MKRRIIRLGVPTHYARNSQAVTAAACGVTAPPSRLTHDREKVDCLRCTITRRFRDGE